MLEIDAPNVPAPVGGLLAALTPSALPTFASLVGITYLGKVGNVTRTVPTDGSLKIFDKGSSLQTNGVKLNVYRGIEDTLFNRDGIGAVAQDAYERGESWAVERALQTLILNVGIPTPDGVKATVDITPTPGTPVTKRLLVLGMLEQYAADNYSGQPVILTNRLGASLLDVEADGGKLFTKQGTPVINAGGLGTAGPDGRTAPAGTAWAYVCGAIQLFKQNVQVIETEALKENRAYALAEGTWLATVDNFVAAILVGN